MHFISTVNSLCYGRYVEIYLPMCRFLALKVNQGVIRAIVLKYVLQMVRDVESSCFAGINGLCIGNHRVWS